MLPRFPTNFVYRYQIMERFDKIRITLDSTSTGTGCHFCDFVVYTFKGTAIDRVYFDVEHWDRLCDKICTFYFKYYLPILNTV